MKITFIKFSNKCNYREASLLSCSLLKYCSKTCLKIEAILIPGIFIIVFSCFNHHLIIELHLISTDVRVIPKCRNLPFWAFFRSRCGGGGRKIVGEKFIYKIYKYDNFSLYTEELLNQKTLYNCWKIILIRGWAEAGDIFTYIYNRKHFCLVKTNCPTVKGNRVLLNIIRHLIWLNVYSFLIQMHSER